ncbi:MULTISPECIES: hypothetical protein [unclassified Acidovorax]|uniref:hypothetical protein n=1 Tax=unclassified Acidovorax TaxID=2684926 RepID=UPI001E3ECC1F|nr:MULTISPECIES: hypothetical protein [unclassified Acidovorax]
MASTSSQAQASLPVTFGQPFKAGDWLHTTQGLVAQVGGATIPLQTDEISSHRDGSARFAVLSAQLSNVQPGEARIINIFPGAKTSSTPSVPAAPDWNLELEAQVYDANGNVTSTLVAQPQTQLATQIANNTGRRLAGAVATEYTVALPLKDKATGAPHPHLSARLHTRLVDNGQRIRTDVVMENTRTWTANPGNITYSFAVKRNGSTIYTQPKFTHYHHARWHKVLWTGSSAEPQARVRHNMPYFMASKAVWNYDLGLTIPDSAIERQYSLLTQRRAEQASLGPMANLMLTAYFPTTGGRMEIGPYPQWTAMYLLNQDSRLREVMLANADAAAAAPTHYRDEGTKNPIEISKYPKVNLSTEGPSEPLLPAVVNGTTIWTPDTPHQASFAYVPYLITGDAFYLDEIQFWATWNVAARNPGYRMMEKGIFYSEQVRGRAWGIRSLGEATRATPDNHPLRGYFSNLLQYNVDWLVQNYPNAAQSPEAPPMGMMPQTSAPYVTSPWQNDFVTIVLSQLVENEVPNAATYLNWITRFTVERFNKQSEGYCTAYAPAYDVYDLDSNNQTINSWAQLFQRNWPGVTCSSDLAIMGSPNAADGYAAYSRGMLGAATNAGVINASSAYTRWKQLTSGMDSAMAADPTWAIVPR